MSFLFGMFFFNQSYFKCFFANDGVVISVKL